MASPINHATLSIGISGLVLRYVLPLLIGALVPIGLGWSLWLIMPLLLVVIGVISHPLLDPFPHVDSVALGTQKDFDDSMAWDPKAGAHEMGLQPALTHDGRAKLRALRPELADPIAVAVSKLPFMLALLDVAVALVITLAWLMPYLNQPLIWLCLGAGAFGAVVPDLVLAKPIHDRIIKNNGYWRFFYIHNWFHAPVMLRQDRWLGMVFQVAMFVLFVWFMMTNRPPVL